jgi:D-glycero-D-manno-heptose 1,7-bisphosphate phosphatase
MSTNIKVVFLDRDGVINKYPGDNDYVKSRKEFEFIPGSIAAIRKLNEQGFKLFVISNQAGVAKKLYSQKDLDLIDRQMLGELKKQKARLDGIFYCTHLSEDDCSCRKPKTGLLEKAVASLSVPIAQSVFVGDSMVDIKTARNFGSGAILVLSGKEKIANRSKWEIEPDFICDNLMVATYYICQHYS